MWCVQLRKKFSSQFILLTFSEFRSRKKDLGAENELHGVVAAGNVGSTSSYLYKLIGSNNCTSNAIPIFIKPKHNW